METIVHDLNSVTDFRFMKKLNARWDEKNGARFGKINAANGLASESESESEDENDHKPMSMLDHINHRAAVEEAIRKTKVELGQSVLEEEAAKKVKEAQEEAEKQVKAAEAKAKKAIDEAQQEVKEARLKAAAMKEKLYKDADMHKEKTKAEIKEA